MTIYDSILLEKCYEVLSKAQTISTNITNIEKTLSDAEKAYVEKLLTGGVGVESASVESETTFSNAEQVTGSATQSSISLKYVFIGLLLGAFFIAGFRKFFITRTDLSDDDKKWIENLKNALKDTDISLTLGNNVLYNPASLALLADADAVLLCEQLGISSYTEICKELQTCADKEIAVMGCVVSGI